MSAISPVYKSCAVENGTCSFTGTQSVAYTATAGNSPIYYRNLTTSTPCNNSIFNDPSVGNQKSCYVAPIPADVAAGGSNFYDSNGNPVGWTKCADESGICNPGAGSPVDVLYGVNSSYVYANTSETPCSNDIFGDPKVGSGKSCYWRNIPTPTPGTPPVTPPSPTPTPPSTKTGLYIGLGAGGIALIIIIIAIVMYMRRARE